MRARLDRPASDEQILLNVAAQACATPSSPKPKIRRAQPMHWDLPGFSGKSKVQTSFGQMPLEMLRRNDPVKTLSGAYLKVRWVDSINLDHEFLSSHSHAQPILIPAGSLGQGTPLVDMLVSPAQNIQAATNVGNSSLRPASELVGRGRINRKPQTAFTYFLFGCETDCSVCIDGVWCSTPPASGS